MIKNKKVMYMMFLCVISLLGIILVPTYAKFVHQATTNNDIVNMNLQFNLEISNIEEYQEIIVPAGNMMQFNVSVENNTTEIAYYGIWYKMVNPGSLPSDGSVEIGKLEGTTANTTGSIPADESTTVSMGIVNSTNNEIKVYIGVNSSTTSTNDIEYLNGKYLVSSEVSNIHDIMISSIVIDGSISNSLPTSGTYTMNSSCTKSGSNTLTWNTYTKTITYSGGAQTRDKCSLTFTSSTEYPLLSTMPVGSYVAYTGVGGTVGSTTVNCSGNACKGANANQESDTSGYTYGYCSNNGYKYYTTGWRIAYVKDGKAVLVSAGSPECNSRTASTANETYIKTANALALKYCNENFVDGDCSCTSTTLGQCSSASTDAWAINDYDFYYITKAISGVGKRLTNDSNAVIDNLGDTTGGTLTTAFCQDKYSYKECGYNNDLIDNGGYYWFASRNTSSSTNSSYGVYWHPYDRSIHSDNSTDMYGTRLMINLSPTVYVTSGSGTMDDPYIIGK